MTKPVAWRKPNYEWSCWDFTSEIPEDDPDGWEPLYLAESAIGDGSNSQADPTDAETIGPEG